jgi:hypothetical protein
MWWWGLLAIVLLALMMERPGRRLGVPSSAIVVGGGWGGVLAARGLLDAGCPSVTLLERSSRLGGVSSTFFDSPSGQHVDLTTCYTHTGFMRFHALMRRLGVAVYVSAQPAVRLDASGQPQSLLGGGLCGRARTLGAVCAYLALWVKWRVLGLSDAENARPFATTLAARGLQRLRPMLAAAMTGQLYSTPEELPTLYAMRWMRPLLLLSALAPPSSNQLVSGFQGAAGAVAAGCTVLLDRRVECVVPDKLRPGVIVRGPAGFVRTLYADVVLLGVDPHTAGVRGCEDRYAAADTARLHVRAAAVRTEPRLHGLPARMYLPVSAVAPRPDTPGEWASVRTFDPKDALGGREARRGVAVFYGFGGGRGRPPLPAVPGMRPGLILASAEIPAYLRHFTEAAIARGAHRAAEAMQGLGRVWLVGGGPLAFDSVDNIHDHVARVLGSVACSLAPSSRWVALGAWYEDAIGFPHAW